MKKIVCSLAGILCFNAALAAPQVSDVIDPIYETATLPNGYYIKEENKNSLTFANSKVPNLDIKISFVKNNSREFYEIVADFMYDLTHSGSNINQCMNDPTYKPFANYEFMCVKDQSSLQYAIFTQFEDDNNQPSDFTRIVSISNKTGDNVSVNDIGEMINVSNYKLGFFENFNIPQKSQLRQSSSVDYASIDLEGMVGLAQQKENLWASSFTPTSLVNVTGSDVTNQGMKFFLKDSSTNEKYIITYTLSTSKRHELYDKTKEAVNSVFHGCKVIGETEGADNSKLSLKCDEGKLSIKISEVGLKKYEYELFEITTASTDLLNALDENKSKLSQIKSTLFKQFYDLEFLHTKDNIFAYIQESEANLKPEAGITYPFDNSTAKSISSLNAVQATNNAKNGTKTANTPTNTPVDSDMIVTTSKEDPLSLDNLLMYGGIVAIVIALILLIIFRKHLKNKKDQLMAYMQQKAAEKEQQKKDQQEDNGGELIAEIEAARIARDRELYKQRKEAEKLAKELEERNKNETEEEKAKRLASLNEFMQKSAMPGMVTATNSQTPAQNQETTQNQTQGSQPVQNQVQDQQPKVEETKDQEQVPPKAEEKPAPKFSLKKDPKPAASETEAPKEEEKPAPKTITINSSSVNIAAEEEAERQRKEEEERRRSEEEKQKREKEFQSVKLKGEDLLMKMKQKQKQASASDEKPKEEPKPTATPFSKDEFVAPVEEPKSSSPAFSNDDFVQPVQETPAPTTEEHHKAKNPFDALVTKGDPSKYKNKTQSQQEASDYNEIELDLDLDLTDANENEESLFGSNNDVQKYDESSEISIDESNEISIEEPSQVDLSNQSIFTDDNMVQPVAQEEAVPADLSNQSIFTDDNMVQPIAQEEPIASSTPQEETPTTSAEPNPEVVDISQESEPPQSTPTSKKRSTKRVRKFNMGSLSISLHDDQ